MAKKIFYLVTVALVLVCVAWFVEGLFRCNKDGLPFEEAIDISSKKLRTDFSGEFLLVKKIFEDDKSWFFSYSDTSVGCAVDIIVDKCGVSDIGGISGKCMTLTK